GAIAAPTQRTAAAAVPFSLLIQGDSTTRIVPGTSGKEGANGYPEVDARTAGLGRGRGDRQADPEPGRAQRGRERDAAQGARGEARDGLRGARAADDRGGEATRRAREAEAEDDKEVDDGAEDARDRRQDDAAAQPDAAPQLDAAARELARDAHPEGARDDLEPSRRRADGLALDLDR